MLLYQLFIPFLYSTLSQLQPIHLKSPPPPQPPPLDSLAVHFSILFSLAEEKRDHLIYLSHHFPPFSKAPGKTVRRNVTMQTDKRALSSLFPRGIGPHILRGMCTTRKPADTPLPPSHCSLLHPVSWNEISFGLSFSSLSSALRSRIAASPPLLDTALRL